MHELCEIFRHAFGKRGDKGAISLFRCLLGLENKIVDLILDRLDLYRWINQSSGTNYLFAEDASCLVHLPRAGGSRHADRLRQHHVPFIEAQGAVVGAAWQAATNTGNEAGSERGRKIGE